MTHSLPVPSREQWSKAHTDLLCAGSEVSYGLHQDNSLNLEWAWKHFLKAVSHLGLTLQPIPFQDADEPARQAQSDLVKWLRARANLLSTHYSAERFRFNQAADRIALEAAAAQPSREAALVKALEEIAADEKIYKGHGNYDEGPLPGNISQEIARKALAAYTPATPDAGHSATSDPGVLE